MLIVGILSDDDTAAEIEKAISEDGQRIRMEGKNE
jgi:hypothetical protein